MIYPNKFDENLKPCSKDIMHTTNYHDESNDSINAEVNA